MMKLYRLFLNFSINDNSFLFSYLILCFWGSLPMVLCTSDQLSLAHGGTMWCQRSVLGLHFRLVEPSPQPTLIIISCLTCLYWYEFQHVVKLKKRWYTSLSFSSFYQKYVEVIGECVQVLPLNKILVFDLFLFFLCCYLWSYVLF